MRIRVVLADRRRIVREGLHCLLARRADIEVVGEAADGETALATARKLRPDIVILESGLDGVEATRRFRDELPQVRVIVLSDHSGCRTAVETLGAGASNFLTGESGFDELLRAVGSVGEGRPADELTRQAMAPDEASAERPRHPAKPLTAREVEVLQLLASGKRVKEIALALHISAKTVESHRQNMMDKLEIHSAIELTRYALREGLVSI